MRATVRWAGELRFEGTTESGHLVPMEGPPDLGGENRAPRPMEVLLVAAGGCSSFDVVHTLRKGRHDVRDCRLEIAADRAAQHPRVFTRLHFHYVVTGRGLRPDRVEHAVRLSAERYCSATAMLAKTAEFSWDFEVVEAG